MDDTRLPPVPMRRLFFRMGGWFVVGLGVPFLVLTLISQIFFSAAERFDEEGLMAVAQVTDKYWTESTDSDGDRTVTYWLSFDFVTQAREEVRVTESVGRGVYDRASVGSQMDIWYLQSQPDRIEVTRGSNRQGANITQVIALVLGAVWLGLFWLVGRWVVEAVRARRYGESEEVEVTEVYRTSVRTNNRPRYRLIWRDGQGREGKSLMRKAEDLKNYEPGSKIRIYQGLKRPWWVGDVGDPPE